MTDCRVASRLASAVLGAWLALGVPGAAVAGPAPPVAVPPDRECTTDAAAAAPQDAWPLHLVGADLAAPLADGAGVTVAVLDSGVDAGHPQLAGAVLPGLDRLYPGGGPGDWDCVGHGTGVASIIAARPRPGSALRGVAPAAAILPIVVGEDFTGTGWLDPAQGAAIATAINDAVGLGAGVIAVPVEIPADRDDLRAAVAAAVSAGVVVVAAVGDLDRGSVPPYPASYPGVVGVGAVDEQAVRVPSSQVSTAVDLVAPGGGVWAAGLGGGYRSFAGTGIATGFVAGAAAALRSANPAMPADQVVARLLATAGASYGGQAVPAGPGPEYGYGLVDVYRALTESVGGSTVAAEPAPVPAPGADRWRDGTGLAAALGGLGVFAALLLAFAPMVARRGRARDWRPGTAAAPRRAQAPVHPTTRLFDDP